MKTLVVGAAGYLGSHVCKLLRERDQDYLGVDAYLWEGQHRPPGIIAHDSWEEWFCDGNTGATVKESGEPWLPGEVLDYEPDVVICLTATLQRNVEELPREVVYRYTYAVPVEYARAFPNAVFVFSSSMAVHGTPKRNWSPYVKAKQGAEAYIRENCKHHRILRFGTLYGPPASDQAPFHPQLLINSMVRDALAGGVINCIHPDTPLRRPVFWVERAAARLIVQDSAALSDCYDCSCDLHDYAGFLKQRCGAHHIIYQPAHASEISYGPDSFTPLNLQITPLIKFYERTGTDHQRMQYRKEIVYL